MRKTYITAAGIATISLITLIGWADQNSGGPGQWLIAGQDLSNSRDQPAEHLINSSNVGTLNLAWTYTTGGSVSATPTVAGNAVYFPDWAGNLYAVEKETVNSSGPIRLPNTMGSRPPFRGLVRLCMGTS
jgi:glucose dehydrogenase